MMENSVSPRGFLMRASRALSVTALLAVLAVGLLFLLPGGLVWAQDAETIEYPENGTGAVATYTAEDPEGTTITWSLTGADSADFDITGGVLTFKESPNYEAAADADNTYNIMVTATDSSGGMDIVEVTVTSPTWTKMGC